MWRSCALHAARAFCAVHARFMRSSCAVHVGRRPASENAGSRSRTCKRVSSVAPELVPISVCISYSEHDPRSGFVGLQNTMDTCGLQGANRSNRPYPRPRASGWPPEPGCSDLPPVPQPGPGRARVQAKSLGPSRVQSRKSPRKTAVLLLRDGRLSGADSRRPRTLPDAPGARAEGFRIGQNRGSIKTCPTFLQTSARKGAHGPRVARASGSWWMLWRTSTSGACSGTQ